MATAAFVCSDELWEHGHGPAHPLKPERLKRTCELLAAYGGFDAPNSQLVPPRPATIEELCTFHTEEYISVVERLSRGERDVNPARYNFGPGDNPIFPGMYESERMKVGAGLVAAELVVSGEADVAFSFSGGFHHARPAYASGFCVFNDVAIAILWLLEQGLRVAYVDIDAHHGDGVQAAFYDTDRVLTISLHESGHYLFPGSGFVSELGQGAGEGYSVNLPLGPYTPDEVYLWAFRQVVPPLVRQFTPDILVSQLGVDTHYRDPLTHLMLTTRGYVEVVREIAALAPRWLAFGGGGYDVDVVPRAWTLAYGVMSGQTFADELPQEYTARYGGARLHDTGGPALSERDRDWTREFAARAVEALRERLRWGDVNPLE
jgi:acetoin utilization protein AcuC